MSDLTGSPTVTRIQMALDNFILFFFAKLILELMAAARKYCLWCVVGLWMLKKKLQKLKGLENMDRS